VAALGSLLVPPVFFLVWYLFGRKHGTTR